ncbi:MAG: GAF domain-containing protein [Thermoleophilia bacterium]|nr:GAF domain-containing protein [Thermoleophilia bacterium]
MADINLLRRADAAGQRLFRELVTSRIAWATVSEVTRLTAVDVAAFSLRAAGCAHPQPCTLLHCLDRLEMKAVLGNRGPRLPGLRIPPGAGPGGRALELGAAVASEDCAAEDLPDALAEVVVEEEGIRSLAAIPVGFGGEVRGMLHVGLRHTGGFRPATMEALQRLCTYSGAALAAAGDRGRVEEVAAMRERRRLARALHDELGQRLFGIGMTAKLARESASSGRPDLVTHLHGLEREIAGAATALRATLRSLDTPSASAGALAVKLREDLAAFTARTGLPAHLLVLGEPDAVDAARADTLIRAVQEGLRNVERHAQASEVVLTIGFLPGALEVVLQDDGVGPAAAADGGYGLASLDAELARLGGEIALVRGDDTGATLKARVPLP